MFSPAVVVSFESAAVGIGNESTNVTVVLVFSPAVSVISFPTTYV